MSESADAGDHPEARRRFLLAAGVTAAGGLGLKASLDYDERGRRASVVVLKAGSYESDLVDIIDRGLREMDFDPARIRRKSVMLKPNLVEPTREAPHINTHPAVIRSVAEVFRRRGAREVFVAEGQGHCRDSDLVLEQAGFAEMLREADLEFTDLNHDDVFKVENRSKLNSLESLYFPRSLKRADLIVSLPKMKTHHWAGVTLSMKNLFGIMPGVVYGWPKNVLHCSGLNESIIDINTAANADLAIVDGIIGMEGDGPIMGTPCRAGVIVLGTNLPAADATAARLMGIDPRSVPYLAAASGRLGPIREAHIEQRGETIGETARRFSLLDHPSLSFLRRT